jgi:hypothetical protein
MQPSLAILQILYFGKNFSYEFPCLLSSAHIARPYEKIYKVLSCPIYIQLTSQPYQIVADNKT